MFIVNTVSPQTDAYDKVTAASINTSPPSRLQGITWTNAE